MTETLLVFDDITEKVHLENQLMQAEKLSSIGLLAAGIAHEVNTPLTGISSYVQMLLKETDPESPTYSILKKIESQMVNVQSEMVKLAGLLIQNPDQESESNTDQDNT